MEIKRLNHVAIATARFEETIRFYHDILRLTGGGPTLENGIRTDAAEAGKESTRDLAAKYGRSARLGERSRGVLDAGAASCCIILKAMASSMQKQMED